MPMFLCVHYGIQNELHVGMLTGLQSGVACDLEPRPSVNQITYTVDFTLSESG